MGLVADDSSGDSSLDNPDGDQSVSRAARRVRGRQERDRAVARRHARRRRNDRRSGNDFELSTTELDELVVKLASMPKVIGARLTGAGFGGCVVALAHRGNDLPGWHVRPSAGASVER
ncbi:MAG: hypothetical protein M3159_00270 [Actinomycetota bacterium]|nr:hypothetical protein [Actinomycetota bacterium]